jgi:hypothetical protein
MKDRIVQWGLTYLKVSRDFLYQKLGTPIHSVSGIRKANILVAVTNTLEAPNENEYQKQNIVIDEREIAIIDKTRIFIEEVNSEF